MARTSVMAPRFSLQTLKFIVKASKQKRPDWLDRNRGEYEQLVLFPLQHLAQHLKSKLASEATGYHFPVRGIGRLRRSAQRAENTGSLFKDWISFSASRPSGSRFERNPNLFFLLQPDDPDGDRVLIAGGLYMPSSRQLRAIREKVAVDPSPFERLFSDRAFKRHFPGGFSDEKMSSRPPRGFDPNHPKIQWLKLQAYFVWKSYSLRDFTSPKFPQVVEGDYRQILRMNDLLYQAIDSRGPVVSRTTPGSKQLLSRIDEIEAPAREMDF